MRKTNSEDDQDLLQREVCSLSSGSKVAGFSLGILKSEESAYEDTTL